MTETRSKWLGGKPAGWITNYNGHQVRFTPSSGIKSGQFSFSDYENSMGKTLEAAKEWQHEMSDIHGLTKNKYRFVTEEDGEMYVEVQLQNDLIMKCEMKHLPIVEERIWTGNRAADKYTYYAKSRNSKKRGQSYALFHRLAYPKLKEIDHINRDGLDNRERNIREGSGRVNANNKRKPRNNTSGYMGVFFESGAKPRWRAQWTDINVKKSTKSFAVSKWGDEAFNKACEWREDNHQEKIESITA